MAQLGWFLQKTWVGAGVTGGTARGAGRAGGGTRVTGERIGRAGGGTEVIGGGAGEEAGGRGGRRLYTDYCN